MTYTPFAYVEYADPQAQRTPHTVDIHAREQIRSHASLTFDALWKHGTWQLLLDLAFDQEWLPPAGKRERSLLPCFGCAACAR